jgi:hypothetical protein
MWLIMCKEIKKGQLWASLLKTKFRHRLIKDLSKNLVKNILIFKNILKIFVKKFKLAKIEFENFLTHASSLNLCHFLRLTSIMSPRSIAIVIELAKWCNIVALNERRTSALVLLLLSTPLP